MGFVFTHDARARFDGLFRKRRKKGWRGVFENELRLVWRVDEVADTALCNERALVHDTDTVADFLDLVEQMRAE